jgi:hypothetical protein
MGRVVSGLPEHWLTLKVLLSTQFKDLTEDMLLSHMTAEQERQREEAKGTSMWVQGGRGAGRGAQD